MDTEWEEEEDWEEDAGWFLTAVDEMGTEPPWGEEEETEEEWEEEEQEEYEEKTEEEKTKEEILSKTWLEEHEEDLRDGLE